MITQAELKEWLQYDPDTGVFTWIKPKGKVKAGDVAGCTNADGYIQIGINWGRYHAQRLAWLYMTGELPDEVDHRDLNKGNNRWGNLRAATHAQNCKNATARKTNTSGVKGVYWDSVNKMWKAQIGVDGKVIHLGRFTNLDQAAAARAAASEKYHGEFGRVA